MLSTTTTNTTSAAGTEKTKERTLMEIFAELQEILTNLFYATFGKDSTHGRNGGMENFALDMESAATKGSMKKFALDVEAAATSLCKEKGIHITIPESEREESEQQLRTAGLLVPILMTYLLGREPAVGINTETFAADDQPIRLAGSGGDQVPDLVKFCNSRLNSGDCFLRAGDCQGETYLLPGGGVFKPGMMKIPTSRLRHGFNKDAEHLREIAAFMVDQAYGGFARVPPTAAATISSSLLPDRDEDSDSVELVSGSLQKWVASICASEDMGSSRFDTNDIHRIGILDILLYNTDRHGGNLLVEKSFGCGASCGKGKNRLIPIDHGLCLPDFRHLNQAEFEWQYWKQASASLSKAELALISSLNGDRVAGILRGLGLPSGSVLTARVMVAVLQQTALKRGWHLRDIGAFCCTAFKAKSSPLADVVATTSRVGGFGDREVLFEEHAVFMDLFNQKLTQYLDGKVAV